MRVLVLGSGGREHALLWGLNKSPLVSHLYVCPGNAGCQQLATSISGSPTDFNLLDEVIRSNQIDMVVIGPEQPLAMGVVDHLNEKFQGLLVLGPTQKCAQLESSKLYAKDFMTRHQIPTAGYFEVTKDNIGEGQAYLRRSRPPIVLKADGLAAGKGVIICETVEEAQRQLVEMLDGQFGEASSTVLIEEFLSGREFSMFVLTDGNTYQLLPIAKDYKRIGEGDQGLNTGGMGSISPVPFVDDLLRSKVIERIVHPTIEGLKNDELTYVGFIFFGLIEVHGDPYVIEYNCRLGDPETQSIVPLISSDLMQHFIEACKGKLSTPVDIDHSHCASVVSVSGGYPLAYEKGKTIKGLNTVPKDIRVFHAGTNQVNKEMQTNGGRVLAINASSHDLESALNRCYDVLKAVTYDKQYYRTDIGFDV